MLRRGSGWVGVIALVVMADDGMTVCADELLYSYEGSLLILDPSTGWFVSDPCESTCSESVEEGAFTLRWNGSGSGLDAYYTLRLAPTHEDVPPPPFWVEWHFLSSTQFGVFLYCDASFFVGYLEIGDIVQMFGDAVSSFSGDDVITGLERNAFHTYRFETDDGSNFCFAVDGLVFHCGKDHLPPPLERSLFTGSDGGCGQYPAVNKWDFIRYGRIAEGEAIVASDPPSGIVDAQGYPALDRFTVTFDAPNYVYIDDISVENVETSKSQNVKSTAGAAPVVTATRRLDNGAPEVVEIVLDRPLSVGQTTRFTFHTAAGPNVVEYTPLFTGGCCLPGGRCEASFAPGCAEQQGIFHEQSDCPPPSACCLPGGLCTSVPTFCCADEGGIPGEANSVCDADADGDGTYAACGDGCPDDPEKISPGLCGCGVADVDNDADTVPDCQDQCPNADDRLDKDGDGIPDCALGLARIPTISVWGLTILTLSLLIAAKILFRGGKPMPFRP